MITAAMTVAEILERHPETTEIFIRNGFQSLANPFLRRTFAHLITIAQACKRHGVPLEPFLEEVNTAASGAWPEPPAVPACAVSRAAPRDAQEPAPGGGPVHPDLNVGEVVSRFPETRAVFSRFFGDGCFTCPSFGREDVGFACGMHGTDVGMFVAACNQAVAGVRGPDLEELTLNEILRRYPTTAPILQRYGLDTCCGGAKRLPEAAGAHGFDPDDILAEMRAALAPPPSAIDV